MSDLIQDLIQQQFTELKSGVRVVIAHPNYLPQHTLLDRFLKGSKNLYLRFDGQRLTQARLVEYFDQAIAAQISAKELSKLEYIILDECDRALPADFERFLTSILSRFSGRVILFTRDVPAYIHTNTELRQLTQFIPASSAHILPDYAGQTSTQRLLEVRALGHGRVRIDGRLIEEWDGALPRSLFFYLVDRGMVTRSEIFETFWPDLSVKEATNVFHVTKRKISEILGLDLTTYWSGFYRIAPEIDLIYDAATFSELVQDSAIAPADEARALLSRAIDLYQNTFLTSVDDHLLWAQKRRRELEQTYGEALIALGKILAESGDQESALGLYIDRKSVV